MTDNPCYGAALVLNRRGYSVVPAHLSALRKDGTYNCTCSIGIGCKGKHPALPTWRQYQTRLSTEQEVKHWFEGKHNWCNLGFFHGSSHTIALDFDGEVGADTKQELEQKLGTLPETVTMFTGGGGEQLIYRQPEGAYISTLKNLRPCLDLRGEKGFSMCPPSLHPWGTYYEWDVDHHPEDWTPQELPARWIEFLTSTSPISDNTAGPPPGQHNADGLIVDGRESVMTRVVYAEFASILRETGSVPDKTILTQRAWNPYSALVDLSKQGRGYSELQTKVRAILSNRHMPRPLTEPPVFD